LFFFMCRMADLREQEAVENQVQSPAHGAARVGGCTLDPSIVRALAAKASTAAVRKSRKLERLQREEEAAARKKIQ
jgi:hypothetical protein